MLIAQFGCQGPELDLDRPGYLAPALNHLPVVALEAADEPAGLVSGFQNDDILARFD